MAEKIDFKKTMKALYAPSAKQGLHLIDVPPTRYLMIDGEGDPNIATEYKDAVETLYPVAYAIKFASSLAGITPCRRSKDYGGRTTCARSLRAKKAAGNGP